MTVEEVPVRRRPRNRRQLVVDAAGPVFSERGYHGASMEEVAARVGISAAALYRHFPNKYALFVECANLMVDRLRDVLGELPDQVALPELLPALAQVTLEHRASGGVYRWEARFLDVEDRRELRAKFTAVVDSVTAALERDLGGTQTRLRASAALGAIGSITLHHTQIARQRAVELLVDAALRAARVDPAAAPRTASAVHLPVRPEPASRRGEILQAAIPLFADHGFRNVSMGQIAGAVGLTSSAIYRHYPVKAEILAAACLQTAAMLEQAAGQALHAVDGPQESLEALAAAYVAYSFENTALISVAEAEIVGLPPDLRRPVTLAQREHVALWERRLAQTCHGLDTRQVRTLVHAGFGVVVEAGRQLRWQDTDANRDAVAALMLGALGLSG
ncbi:TetR/AcrR family transcriptional regulator [Nocardioides pantholopis]|uniref:TetR/AcrR family transcriptional regulator n=1 Tax=Nocardioides pantholopis TaxID=2483798 RepID=UPI000F0737BD|nr:TetR/AcrR family transcriptional regulator [Nocardioides pantholopis]